MVQETPRLDRWSSRYALWWSILACLACTAMLAYRCPDAFTNPQFYAEDGRYFFADAYNNGWTSLCYRANGYFHLYPRLLANTGLSVGIPVLWMPALFVAGTFLVYVVVWAYVLNRMPIPFPGRVFAVLTTVLVPLGNEVWMNLTNVQWVMSLLIPLIVWGTPGKGLRMLVVDGTLLILACFTGPYALVFLPIMILQVLRERRTGKWSIRRKGFLAIVVLASALCALSLIDHGSVTRTDPGTLSALPAGAVQYLFYQLWYPVLSIGIVPVPFILQVLLTALACWFLWIRFGKGTHRISLFSLRVLTLGALYACVTLVSYRGDLSFLSPFDAGIRNFYLPSVLLIWAGLCIPWNSARSYIPVWTLFYTWFVVQTVFFIGRSRAKDMDWPKYADHIGTIDLDVPITPNGWTMHLHARASTQAQPR